MLGVVRAPVDAPMELVKICKHRLDAIRLCAQLSGLSYEQIAQRVGLDKGHFTRIMQGKAYLPDTKSVLFMVLCGNFAPLQYEAWACKKRLMCMGESSGTSSLMDRTERAA